MASRKTMPRLSCTDGRQKMSALTYSSARLSRETSPRRVTVSPSPSLPWSLTTSSHSGPLPTMRTRASGIPGAGGEPPRGDRRCACAGTCARRRGCRAAARARLAAAKSDVHRSSSMGSGTTTIFPPPRRTRAGDAAGIAAGRDHDVRAPRIETLPARLYREQRAGQPALVPELVGDDALEAHDERRRRRRAQRKPSRSTP